MSSAALTTALAARPAPIAAEAQALRTALETHGRPTRPVIRAVHHLACSGGTLISRAIAAQARTHLLSEVDPFTTLMQQGNFYAPTDVIQAARNAGRRLDPAVTETMFLSSLRALSQELESRGAHAVVRAHAHSQFHTTADPAARPSLNALFETHFTAHQVVTLRHPLDCWLGLNHNDWLHFQPATLDEYCQRTTRFLQTTAGLPRVYYEDFVADPDAALAQILAALDLSLTPRWRTHMGLKSLTGDSGRAGVEITARPRRMVPTETTQAAAASPAYAALCADLGYDPDPAAPAGRQG